MLKYKDKKHFITHAIEVMKKQGDPTSLEEIKNSEDVIEFHHNIGRQVRNFFGLWNLNEHLGHADILSHHLLEELQKDLNNDRK